MSSNSQDGSSHIRYILASLLDSGRKWARAIIMYIQPVFIESKPFIGEVRGDKARKGHRASTTESTRRRQAGHLTVNPWSPRFMLM